MSQQTDNTEAFIEAEVVSNFILRNLNDGLIGGAFSRNVSDFMNGDQLNLKTIGSITLQEVNEGVEVTFSAIESGEITFAITEEVGDAWSVSDNLREDGNQVEALMAARAEESTRAYQEAYETDLLAAIPLGFSAASTYALNGQAHNVGSTETDDLITIKHFLEAKLAFNKAKVPAAGRVFIIDSMPEATLSNLVTITSSVTDFAVDIVKGNMSSDMGSTNWRLHGWEIITSNRLYVANFNNGATTITAAVHNIGMCILSDQHKPIVSAWRRMPKVETQRNITLRQDEFTSSARWGHDLQRWDTAYVLATSSTVFE